MNWKKLLSIGALTMFSASIATGQGTAPTIVQGDYISNVFGNSNFIKNPNAKLNNKDVTVSNATVTRSTTTPLVATSEFLVTTSTATGFADWSLRAFDQGMKNNNCEARFTYLGFSVGSTTAQILQGANVVAQLTLTPSTDPRIASINFPCGDLSQVTKFRLQQASAALTGTNKIGGIYTGLATNMANVAQAEMVGTVTFNNGSAGKQGITSTWTEFDAGTWTPTVIGQGTGSNRLQIAFSYLPAGRYYVNAIINPVVYGGTTTSHGCRFGIQETTSGTVVAIKDNAATPANIYKTLFAPINGNFDFTTGAARTFRIVVNGDGYSQSASGNCFSEQTGDGAKVQLAVYRFPSSSELVVTPERQNVFAAASWTGGIFFTRTNTTEFTISDAVFSTNRTAFGKAQFTGTANDVAITIPQMPPGTYKIELVGESLRVQQTAAGSLDASCKYYLKDGTNTATGSSVLYGPQYTIDSGAIAVQIVKYTSIADRTFTASAQSVTTNSTACGVYQPKIIITPLDQPSNSALYVQGPVKAAETGAAIPSGYVFEHTSSNHNFTITNNAALTQNITSFSLNPGVWMVESSCNFRSSASGTTAWVFAAIALSDASGSVTGTDQMSYTYAYMAHITASQYYNLMAKRYINVTSTTTYYLNTQNSYGANNPTVDCTLKRTRLN